MQPHFAAPKQATPTPLPRDTQRPTTSPDYNVRRDDSSFSSLQSKSMLSLIVTIALQAHDQTWLHVKTRFLCCALGLPG